MLSILKDQKLMPQSPGQVVLAAAAGQQSTIVIPGNQPWVPAKSRLNFKLTVPVQTNAAHRAVIHGLTVGAIQRMELYTATGVILADINDANYYLKSISRVSFSAKDFAELPAATCSTADAVGTTCGIQVLSAYPDADNAIPSAPVLTEGGHCANDPVSIDAGMVGADPRGYGDGSSLIKGSYFIAGTAGVALNVNYSIPLEVFRDSIFASSQHLYIGNDNLFLRITWDTMNKVYCRSDTDILYPSANANAADTVTISNLSLVVQQERNQQLVDAIVAESMSEQGRNIGFTDVREVVTQGGLAAGPQSTTTRFNRGYGRTLKRVYYSVFDTTNTHRRQYDNGTMSATGIRTAAVDISSIYRTFNFNRLDSYDLDLQAWDDYNAQYSLLKGSACDAITFAKTTCWVSDFTGMQDMPLYELVKLNDKVEGIPLDVEQNFGFYANNVAANKYHRAWASFGRVLSVSRNGVKVD